MKKLTILCAFIAWSAGSALCQEELTPRDAFWSASDLVDIAPNPATQNTAPNDTKATQAQPQKTARHPPPSQPKQQKAVLVAAKGYGAQPHIVRYQKASQQPLGLRYALLKVGPKDELTEVLPETVFHSGDKLKVSLMANQSGYVYIIQRGSSGTWRSLFPSPDDEPESNRVEAGEIYEMPTGKSFQFNEQKGSEHLFILLSRQAVSDLDGVIFNLRQGQKDQKDPPDAAPAQVEASNRISDDLVQQLEGRDLTVAVDPPQEAKDSSLGENATYVVSKGTGDTAASQVFANLVLDHQ